MTPAASLTAKFHRKWRPAEEPAALEFARDLDELRAAEFHAARQLMAREIVSTVTATCHALAQVSPEFQPAPFRAVGPFSTMSAGEIQAMQTGLAKANGAAIQTFQCSLCGGDFSTPETAAGHDCPTAREIKGHHYAPPEPATNINTRKRPPDDTQPV